MTETAMKAKLHRYLQVSRDTLMSKLEGLSEYDLRRPLTPTGTNLLGLVKHVAGVESEYFGLAFDRPFPNPPQWLVSDTEPNADMWATAGESTEEILDLYRRVWEHSDATIAALDLNAPGVVPWWNEDGGKATLHTILVHMIAEGHQHAGHADIVRELIDGTAGLTAPGGNMPKVDESWWRDYHRQVEDAAKQAGGRD